MTERILDHLRTTAGQCESTAGFARLFGLPLPQVAQLLCKLEDEGEVESSLFRWGTHSVRLWRLP